MSTSSNRKEEKEKQTFLRTAIIEEGYDPEKFVDYLISRRGENAAAIESWTMTDLKSMVGEFKKEAGSQLKLDESTRAARAQSRMNNADFIDDISDVESPVHKRRVDNSDLHRKATQAEQEHRERILDTEDFTVVPSESEVRFKDWLEKETQLASQSEKELVEFSTEIESKEYLETELSKNTKIKAIITSSKLVKGGFFTSSYVLYTILTKPTDNTVERRYSDFYWLRTIFVRDSPGVFVPSFNLDSSYSQEKYEVI